MLQRLFVAGLTVKLVVSINSAQTKLGFGSLQPGVHSGSVASNEHDADTRDLVVPCRNPRGGGVCEDLPPRHHLADSRRATAGRKHAAKVAEGRHLAISRTSAWAAVRAAGEGPAPQRIMFGSCNGQTFDQSFWNNLAAPGQAPDIMVLAGDNVYGDCTTDACDELAAAYEMLAESEPFQHFAEAVPLLAVWDDHDYGQNDAHSDFSGKEISKQFFLEFFDALEGQARHTPGRSAEGRGIQASYMLGPQGQEVQIILLDTRWYRDAFRDAPTELFDRPGTERYVHDADITGTMLGEVQWQWLEDELARPARLRLVVSGFQFLSESHGWESWACLPSERSRMLELLRSTSPVPIVLSGDRHVGGIYRTSDSPTIWEVTSSSFTHTHHHPINDVELQDPLRVGALLQENNVGLVEVDWGRSVVRLSLRTTEHVGESTHVVEVPL